MGETEMLVDRLKRLPYQDVRSVFIHLTRIHKGREDSARRHLITVGFEQINAPEDAILTADGRVIMRTLGAVWALRPEIHAQQQKEAMDRAKMIADSAKPTQLDEAPGESLTSVLCPSCKSVMAKQHVCPNCSKGKQGFKILCQCTECGHEVYL